MQCPLLAKWRQLPCGMWYLTSVAYNNPKSMKPHASSIPEEMFKQATQKYPLEEVMQPCCQLVPMCRLSNRICNYLQEWWHPILRKQ